MVDLGLRDRHVRVLGVEDARHGVDVDVLRGLGRHVDRLAALPLEALPGVFTQVGLQQAGDLLEELIRAEVHGLHAHQVLQPGAAESLDRVIREADLSQSVA